MASAKQEAIVEAKRTAKVKLECPVCGRMFYSPEMFANHKKVNHPTL